MVPAVDRAARLLEVLESAGRPMTISELARQLGINKGTMRDLLETLRAHGILERDEGRKQYRLGPRLARLGMAALGQLDLASVARPYLVDLAQEINAAVLLVVPHGDRATIVDKVDGGRVAVEVSATVGRRICRASGPPAGARRARFQPRWALRASPSDSASSLTPAAKERGAKLKSLAASAMEKALFSARRRICSAVTTRVTRAARTAASSGTGSSRIRRPTARAAVRTSAPKE